MPKFQEELDTLLSLVPNDNVIYILVSSTNIFISLRPAKSLHPARSNLTVIYHIPPYCFSYDLFKIAMAYRWPSILPPAT